MRVAVTTFAAAVAALAISATPATSDDAKTWYVYCEGADQSDHWAVFSENFWGHPITEGYGRRVSSAAKDFFETRHALQLEGCAAVNFVDHTLAEHSRNRTAQLHKSMGDRIFYFQFPREALPVDVAAAPAPVMVDAAPANPRPEPTATPAKVTEPRPGLKPRRPER